MSRSVFVLDDDPERVESFRHRFRDAHIVVAWNFFEAVALVSAWPRFDAWFLDHDLGTRDSAGPGMVAARSASPATWPECAPEWELTGHDFAKWAAECVHAKRPDAVVVHSWNAAGAERMRLALTQAGWMGVACRRFGSSGFWSACR